MSMLIWTLFAAAAGESSQESVVPVDMMWKYVSSLGLVEALTFISFGSVCLFYGWRVFKILVTICFGLLGLTLGIWANDQLIGGNVIWLSLICTVFFAVLSIPFMRWGVTLLGALALLTVAIGGIVEIAPLFWIDNTVEKVEGMRPYTPLELEGRDIYIREGCYTCHSQMVRPLRDEVERYGHYSLAAESMYDHPFQWGSKRTGPDLARIGNKYSDDWHVRHMIKAGNGEISGNGKAALLCGTENPERHQIVPGQDCLDVIVIKNFASALIARFIREIATV